LTRPKGDKDMPQFMIEGEFEVGSEVSIGGKEAHHILNALRLTKGNSLIISDGKGKRFKGIISSVSRKEVFIRITEVLPSIEIPRTALAIGITKGSKMDFIVQKSVELGVERIVPFSSKRTVPRYSSECTVKKVDRWNRIAMEAAKQSGFPFLPHVENIKPFDEMIQDAGGYKNKIIFYEGEERIKISDYFKGMIPAQGEIDKTTIIVIGAEGGFEEEEVKKAMSYGFASVSLGRLVLKVETAAIVAISLVQYFMRGDM